MRHENKKHIEASGEPFKVVDILEKYLFQNGFDGLCNPIDDCACKIGNLMPCEKKTANCLAGELSDCQKCEAWDYEDGCSLGLAFCIDAEEYADNADREI